MYFVGARSEILIYRRDTELAEFGVCFDKNSASASSAPCGEISDPFVSFVHFVVKIQNPDCTAETQSTQSTERFSIKTLTPRTPRLRGEKLRSFVSFVVKCLAKLFTAYSAPLR